MPAMCVRCLGLVSALAGPGAGVGEERGGGGFGVSTIQVESRGPAPLLFPAPAVAPSWCSSSKGLLASDRAVPRDPGRDSSALEHVQVRWVCQAGPLTACLLVK